MGWDKFIAAATTKFGNKYEFEHREIVRGNDEVTARCPVHGPWKQRWQRMLDGRGCAKCRRATPDWSEFLQLSRAKFGDRYQYVERVIKTLNDDVTLVCPVHGEFTQRIGNHLRGKGCPDCVWDSIRKHPKRPPKGIAKPISAQEFERLSTELHKGRYAYRQDYKGRAKQVGVCCPDHGWFTQLGASHLEGHGCPECGREKLFARNASRAVSYNEFIIRARAVHGDKFEYPEEGYAGVSSMTKIVCPAHGPFLQHGGDHQTGHGCAKCSPPITKPAQAIGDLIPGVEFNNRTVLAPMEVDIWSEQHRLGIEYHGLYWHSDRFKDRGYHHRKWLAAEKAGIRLIQIFEDEWLDKPELVTRMLQHATGSAPRRLHARKGKIVRITPAEAGAFLDANHIQGRDGTPVAFALVYDKIEAVMTFTKPRLSGGDSEAQIVLNRYAASASIPGGFSRLFRHAVSELDLKSVATYSDNRWFSGGVYASNGFRMVGNVSPTYWYFSKTHWHRQHRFGFRKDALKQKMGELFNPQETEFQNADRFGLLRVWDAGKRSWMWSA